MIKVYLAGKISANGWRHRLVPNLRDSTWNARPLKFKNLLYTGPFFVSCDHACYHGPTGHGALSTQSEECSPSLRTLSRGDVHRHCLKAIDESDVLLAWINEHKCYGTVAEIQYALTTGKKVVVAFAPNMASREINEFWFISINAHKVEFHVRENDLPRILGEL